MQMEKKKGKNEWSGDGGGGEGGEGGGESRI